MQYTGERTIYIDNDIKHKLSGVSSKEVQFRPLYFLIKSLKSAVSAYWRVVHIGRKAEFNIRLILISFLMPFKSKFSTDDSIQLVAWWYELKDIHKVQWRYAKDKGIKKFSRKLPSRRVFKCFIDRFKSTVK